MSSVLADLGLPRPVLAAPMAGGPTTPALVLAAGFGFLAGGYMTASALVDQVATVRAGTGLFGVNLFAPNPVPVELSAYQRYARALQPEADRYGLSLPGDPVEDDDHWSEKLDLLRSDPVPVVSFTFGLPDRSVIAGLRRAGTVVVQTVTSAAEARAAAEAGIDALAVQAAAAGGHWGTLTPHDPPPALGIVALVESVRAAVTLPLVAAGGLGTPEQIAEVLHAGAEAAMVGTALLLATESGTSAPYRDALADPSRRQTVVTRSFTGRPARALRNLFTDRYDDAPPGYPALHHLTRPIRLAAATAGDAERINLWAGTGARPERPEPASDILARLTARL